MLSANKECEWLISFLIFIYQNLFFYPSVPLKICHKSFIGRSAVRDGALSQRLQAGQRHQQGHQPAGPHHQWRHGQHLYHFYIIYLSKYIYIYIYIYIDIYLSIYLSIYLCPFQSIFPSTYLSIFYLFLYRMIHLSIYLSIYVYLSL